jgi:formylglycine-generating enzyme required for sulfatase activity
MVYIPQGSFYAGDSTDPVVTNTYKTGTTRLPYLVAGNSSVVTFGTAPGSLNDTLILNNFSGNATGFPTGYDAFWMMKYELSQGAYRDFLNTLTLQQQVTRFAPLPTAAAGTNLKLIGDNFRQGIEIITPASLVGNTVPAVVGCDIDNDNIYNETTDGEWIPVGNINWGDVAAYLDWAGLRPMTELEYEKACRGPLPAVAGELAWGAATYNSVSLTLSNAGLATETITNPSSFVGNLLMNTSFGPARGGIFANAFSTRISSGAGYYGVMELSGNLWECSVQTNTLAGRSFNGKHGDGILTSVGNANENFWPGINGSINSATSSGFYDGGLGVRSTAGISFKGGSFYLINLNPVSLRLAYNSPSLVTNQGKENTVGIRGVRDAN